jgi:hypothetical protein
MNEAAKEIGIGIAKAALQGAVYGAGTILGFYVGGKIVEVIDEHKKKVAEQKAARAFFKK